MGRKGGCAQIAPWPRPQITIEKGARAALGKWQNDDLRSTCADRSTHLLLRPHVCVHRQWLPCAPYRRLRLHWAWSEPSKWWPATSSRPTRF